MGRTHCKRDFGTVPPTPVHSKHSFSTNSGFMNQYMLDECQKNRPVNLVWKKVCLVCWLESGQGGAGLMDGKHPNKRVEIWDPDGSPNLVLCTACWEPFGSSLDLPVL